MLLRLSPFSDVTKFGEILEVFGNFYLFWQKYDFGKFSML